METSALIRECTEFGHSKCFLAGGYLVLDHNPALIVALQPTVSCQARLWTSKCTHIIVHCLPMERTFRLTPEEWSSFTPNGQFERFIISCLQVFFAVFPQHDAFKLELQISGDTAFYTCKGKTGLGSSAATTVAIIKSLVSLFDVSDTFIFKLAAIAHSTAQNSIGSCFDISCALYGTQIYTCPTKTLVSVSKINDEWDATMEKVGNSQLHLFLLGTGFDGSSTPSLVKIFKSKITPTLYNEYKSAAAEAITAFQSGDDVGPKFTHLRRIQRQITIECGCPIVPDEVEALALKIELVPHVLAAVVPGAGGYDSIAALTDSENVDFSSLDIEILTHTVCE